MPLTNLSTFGLSKVHPGLVRVGLDLLDGDEEPKCAILATETFVTWADGSLPYMTRKKADDGLEPSEDVDFFMAEFQRGRTHCTLARLQPTRDGVWEVKLDDTRIFGGFIIKRVLVLADGVDVSRIKSGGDQKYEDFRQSVLLQGKKLGLQYVTGDIRSVFN